MESIAKKKEIISTKDAQLNLIGHGINALLENNLISLSDYSHKESGYLLCNISGRAAFVRWYDVGYDELSITVWWGFNQEQYELDTEKSLQYQYSFPSISRGDRSRYVSVIAGGFLERASGKFIQSGKNCSGLFDCYVARGFRDTLLSIDPVKCNGFELTGKLIM